VVVRLAGVVVVAVLVEEVVELPAEAAAELEEAVLQAAVALVQQFQD
jgi:hypothetical protein